MSSTVGVDDFIMLSQIGKGTYAKVLLVRHKVDNKLYALKILKKRYIIEKNQEEHIMTYKAILAKINHPFLIQLHWSFQD